MNEYDELFDGLQRLSASTEHGDKVELDAIGLAYVIETFVDARIKAALTKPEQSFSDINREIDRVVLAELAAIENRNLPSGYAERLTALEAGMDGTSSGLIDTSGLEKIDA